MFYSAQLSKLNVTPSEMIHKRNWIKNKWIEFDKNDLLIKKEKNSKILTSIQSNTRYNIYTLKYALDDDEKVQKTNFYVILTDRENNVIVRLDVLRYASHITFQKSRDNLSWFPLENTFIDRIILYPHTPCSQDIGIRV